MVDSMNIIDMIIIAVVCFCMIRGIFRGLSSELSSTIAVISGFYSAYLFYPQLVRHLPRQVPVGQYADIVGFALIFCAVYLTVILMGLAIKYALNITMMGWVDRILGAWVGALKGALLASVMVFALVTVTGFQSPGLKESRLSEYALSLTQHMAMLTTGAPYKGINKKVKALQTVWEKRKS